MGFALSKSTAWNLRVAIPFYLAGLFICCMFCHGELARLKPQPRLLTRFYLMVSSGGALGAIFVGVIAPRAFNSPMELPVGLLACSLLLLFVSYGHPVTDVAWSAVVIFLMVITGLAWQTSGDRVVVRNFYGALRVREYGEQDERFRVLINGTIVHGGQFTSPRLSRQAATYYSPESGIGQAMSVQCRSARRVGVIGLGVGTLAAYGRRGDYFRFYEINPLVVQLARAEFRFLADSAATIDVVLGDARLSLERERSQQFDMLVVDAFSGDSIPVHLLTREALKLYFLHLKPSGLLAVHVSNNYLNLPPVVAAVAESFRGREALLIENKGDGKRSSPSGWVLVFDDRKAPAVDALTRAGKPIRTSGTYLWSDDYSSLLRVLN